MAKRGRPLSFDVREQIRDYARRGISQRRTARLLDLNRRTVKKYSKKNAPPAAAAA